MITHIEIELFIETRYYVFMNYYKVIFQIFFANMYYKLTNNIIIIYNMHYAYFYFIFIFMKFSKNHNKMHHFQLNVKKFSQTYI